MFTRWFLHHGNVNDVISDVEGAGKGRYGFTRGLIWVNVRTDMGSHEQTVIGLESQAISAEVTKHFITIFRKCNNVLYPYFCCNKLPYKRCVV